MDDVLDCFCSVYCGGDHHWPNASVVSLTPDMLLFLLSAQFITTAISYYKHITSSNTRIIVHLYILRLSVGFVPCNVCQFRWEMSAFNTLCMSRFPLYYELKIAVVIWLLSPYTRGASLIYRKCLHPLLSSKERVRPLIHLSICMPFWRYQEGNLLTNCSWFFFPLQEIDEYIVQARERSYETMVSFGKQGLSIAATAAVTAAVKASYFEIILSLFKSVLCGN